MPFDPPKLTPEIQQQFETASPDEDFLVCDGGTMTPYQVMVRRPTRQEAIGYKAHHRRDPTTSSEELCKRIIVWPEKEVVERMAKKFGGFFYDGIVQSDPFQKFVGLAVGEQVKS